MKFTHALVRPPGKSYAQAINDWYAKSHLGGKPLDLQIAIQQHKQYAGMLRRAGLKVITLHPDERFPDSCFVQDPAVIFQKDALITQQHAQSRNGEGIAIARGLHKYGFSTITMTNGFCDGGDVLVAHDLGYVWVGISKRTDEVGFTWVKSMFMKYSYTVIPVPVTNCLHLMTSASYLSPGIALMSELVDHDARNMIAGKCKEIIEIPADETYAVNVIQLGGIIIMPEGFPFTQNKISKLGYMVRTVPMSEFEKADGGITCLSLLF